MPKRIKREVLTKTELHNRVIEIIAMLVTLVFGGVLIALLNDLMNQESGGWRGCVVFALYMLFFIMAVVHFVHGLYTFKRLENYGILFQAIMSGAAAFTALVNAEFAVVLFLSSIGADGTAEKLLGDRSMNDFVTSQSSNWTLLLFGMAAVIIVGICAVMRFAKR